MSWFSRFANVFRSSALDHALDEELRFHIEARIDELISSGMPRHAAEALARRQFGSPLRTRESSRDVKSLSALEDLARDVHHAWRGFRRAPLFASIVILTLGIGIGANSAILSVVNGVLLRPLGYPSPAQLMFLTTDGAASRLASLSVAEYLEFRQFSASFADTGAFRLGETNLTVADRALRVRSATVDAPLLKTLQTQSMQGRLFAESETGILTPPPVAVISYELWRSVFGARPVLGERVDVAGSRVEIIGIMAPPVDLMDTRPEIWLPLGFTDDEPRLRSNHTLSVIARLKEDVTPAAAKAQLTALVDGWSARTGIMPGPGHEGHVIQPGRGAGAHLMQMTPLVDEILGRAGRAIWMLQAAVGLVLLIACANVANLLLTRAETRRREFAVLAALGASRGRLVRRAATESLMLSVAGGALGVLLARAGVEIVVRTFPASLPRIGEVTVDLSVVLVSLSVATACGLLFGFAPLTHLRSHAMADALKSTPRGSSGTTRHRLRRALVMGEVALAVLVVAGAGLLLRTVSNLIALDTGFERSRLVTFGVTLPVAAELRSGVRGFGVPSRGPTRTYQRMLEALRAVPGVDGATAMTDLPLDRPLVGNQTEFTSYIPSAGPPIVPVSYQRVMSRYFETMNVPILHGRGFAPTDERSGRVAVVNETLARTIWEGLDPVGKQLRPGGGDMTVPVPGGSSFVRNPWFTVIGVAKDVKQRIDETVRPEVYVLVDQVASDLVVQVAAGPPLIWVAYSPTTMHIAVRTTLPLATLAPALTSVVRNVDPTVPVARLREMDDVLMDSIERPRLLAHLVTVFATLALLLAAIGTYGVLAYIVTERRLEIGIRLALGAARASVLRQVLAQGLRLTIVGIVVGVAGAIAVSRLMESLLFGVQPTDAPTMTTVIATILIVGAVACWLPAWRASRLNPNLVLRAD
jgi:predicted permease